MGKPLCGNMSLVPLSFRYSSSAEINPYSALIHNFFAQETGPSTPAIHLTVDTEALAKGNAEGALAFKAYVA